MDTTANAGYPESHPAVFRFDGMWSGIEECAGRYDVLCAGGVSKEPVMADAAEPLGQHVQQESPDKLVGVKPAPVTR